jgi:hypothetical protein
MLESEYLPRETMRLRIYFDADFHDGTYREYSYDTKVNKQPQITLRYVAGLMQDALETRKAICVQWRTYDYNDYNVLLLDGVKSMKIRKVTVHNSNGDVVGKLNEQNEYREVAVV